MTIPEGYRLGEICEFLGRVPSELGDVTEQELTFLNEYLNERARKLEKAFGGGS